MKKFSLLAIAFLMFSMSVKAAPDDDQVINIKETPAKVQEFVNTHFAKTSVRRVEKDSDSYDVELKNGFELEFHLDGEWKSVDGKRSAVPQSVVNLLPAKTLEYLNQNYAKRKIGDIANKSYGYKVDFIGMPDIELVFDKDGNFVRIDR